MKYNFESVELMKITRKLLGCSDWSSSPETSLNDDF